EDVAGRDELVARVLERRGGGVEVEYVLRLHVLAHDGLSPCANVGAGHARTLTLAFWIPPVLEYRRYGNCPPNARRAARADPRRPDRGRRSPVHLRRLPRHVARPDRGGRRLHEGRGLLQLRLEGGPLL